MHGKARFHRFTHGGIMRKRRRAMVTVERFGRRFREPAGRFRPAHQARSALGVWACSRSRADRAAVKAWKASPPFDEVPLAEFAAGLVRLITAWCPVLPGGYVLTTPPQGASAPGPYAAEALGRRVAEALGLEFVDTQTRTEPKLWHGVIHSLKQDDYVYRFTGPMPTMVLVVDDLATTGRTLRLSLEAIRTAGIPAFGFAFSGV